MRFLLRLLIQDLRAFQAPGGEPATAESSPSGTNALLERSRLCGILEHQDERIELLLDYYQRSNEPLDHFAAELILLQPLDVLIPQIIREPRKMASRVIGQIAKWADPSMVLGLKTPNKCATRRLTIRFLAKAMHLTTVAAKDLALLHTGGVGAEESDSVLALKNIAFSCATMLLQWTLFSHFDKSDDNSVAKDWNEGIRDIGKTVSGSRSREGDSSCGGPSTELGRYADVVVSFPAILSAYELLRADSFRRGSGGCC